MYAVEMRVVVKGKLLVTPANIRELLMILLSLRAKTNNGIKQLTLLFYSNSSPELAQHYSAILFSRMYAVEMCVLGKGKFLVTPANT